MSDGLKRELDEMRERAETAERQLRSITGMERTRLAEINFKAGFDKGIEFQKKATPPPKAKQYRDALKEAYEALVAVDLHDTESTPAERSMVRVRVEKAITKAEAVLR
jgi:Tfp pilus assembly protein PilO